MIRVDLHVHTSPGAGSDAHTLEEIGSCYVESARAILSWGTRRR
jgi:histidinol phosphatase-like PHP family hydrolase